MTRFLVLTQRGPDLRGDARRSWADAVNTKHALEQTVFLEEDAAGVHRVTGDLRKGDELVVVEVAGVRRFPVETHRPTLPADAFTDTPTTYLPERPTTP